MSRLVLNTLPFGLSVSASARIGNLIGAQKSMHARLSAHMAAFLSVCLGALVMVILLIVRNVSGLVKLFSSRLIWISRSGISSVTTER